MKITTKITITEEKANYRLDVFLAEFLQISRSSAQKMIDENLATVNGKLPKKAGDFLKTGNVVEILPEIKTKKTSDEKKPAVKISSDKKSEKLVPKIIAETKDYLVIEKPSGLLTHATMAEEKESVASFLAKKYPAIKKVGDDPKIRPGIVHRLDKEASGLLVVARNQKMFECLKEQFKNRTVEKEYWALVHGKVQRDWEILSFPIARSETSDRMAARPIVTEMNEGEKEAKTEFFVEKKFVNFTLVKVILHTGRMHQIRVHFLAYNHPLVGDPLYFQKKQKRTWDEKLGRLFLHSTKLSFIDLKGERQTFESKLPDKLSNFLNELA